MDPTLLFKALADDIRLVTLLLIEAEQEICVCELMVALEESSQPKVSRHLAVLKKQGLVSLRKHKQWVFYSLSSDLPSWITELIQLTKLNNQDYLSPYLTRLNKMGDRPARQSDCCD